MQNFDTRRSWCSWLFPSLNLICSPVVQQNVCKLRNVGARTEHRRFSILIWHRKYYARKPGTLHNLCTVLSTHNVGVFHVNIRGTNKKLHQWVVDVAVLQFPVHGDSFYSIRHYLHSSRLDTRVSKERIALSYRQPKEEMFTLVTESIWFSVFFFFLF